MNASPIGVAVRHLCRLAAAPNSGETSDAQLLERFVHQRDESAFELLVWRHGPMVHGLCCRVLRDGHGAEDAFQATFLVLARKAGAIGRYQSVGSWLYKVAYRVALRARDQALRRARREQQVPELPAVEDPRSRPDPGWAELRPVLDEELSRLPDEVRAPVVLCYLEGLTNEEAARKLACPVGTVKTRLAHARRVLAARLIRRGLSLAAAVFSIEGALPAGAAPPVALVGTTVRGAALAVDGVLATGVVPVPVAHLTEGVLRAMMVTKLKTVAAVLVLVAAAFTASLNVLAEERSEEKRDPPRTLPAEARVAQLEARMAELNQQLREARKEAARERAVPPRDKPIAIIFGEVPITRDELADYLLTRMNTGELEKYLSLRILEHGARTKGIRVTDAEMNAQIEAELRRSGMTEATFREKVLRTQQKTIQEWKEDVVRPQLLLKKLSAVSSITDASLRAAFEIRHGEKVECRVIVVRTGKRSDAEDALQRLRSGKATFEKEAERWGSGSAAPCVTLSRRLTGDHGNLARAAFSLQPGEISGVMGFSGQFVILECRRRIPPDSSKRFEDVREELRAELSQQIQGEAMKQCFDELKVRARPRIRWSPPREDVKRPN